MKKTVAIGVAVLAAAVLLAAVTTYNRLVGAQERVDAGWSQVDNVLQRRADLVPNLVETVRGYAGEEREVFTAVAEARGRLLAARGPAEAATADQQVTASLGRLLALAEAYPTLRASENFARLQDELAGTENRIAVERMRYNEVARAYNAAIRRFPTRLVATVLGFDRREYFEAAPGQREAPAVRFAPR
jgi:LemA protein